MSVPRSRFFQTRVITRLYRLAARRSRITAMRHPAILARMLSLHNQPAASGLCRIVNGLMQYACKVLQHRRFGFAQRVARHAIASLPDRLELARERSENRTIAFRLIQPGQQECIDQPPDEHYACAPAEYAAPFALRAERFQCERPGSREQRRCGQRPRLDGQRIVERKPALKPNEPCMALNRLAHRPP